MFEVLWSTTQFVSLMHFFLVYVLSELFNSKLVDFDVSRDVFV